MSAVLAACGGQGGSTQGNGGSPAVSALAAAIVSVAPPQTYTVANIDNGFQIDNPAKSLNDNGQVCGAFPFPQSTVRNAALFQDGNLKNLNPSGSTARSNALAINSKGQVTGTIAGASGNTNAFFYDGTVTSDLGGLGGPITSPSLINVNGDLAGLWFSQGGLSNAFLYSGGQFRDLSLALPAAFGSAPHDINDQGQLVGEFRSLQGPPHAFLYANGAATDIGALGGAGASSQAFAINANGVITGTSFNGTVGHAFRYENATMSDLGALNDPTASSIGLAINASGLIAGDSPIGAATTHAFVHDGATMQDLGTLGGAYSHAAAINAAGHVVGKATKADGTQHGFIWSAADGAMVDLNDRIQNAPGIEILSAEAITDGGFILARANTGWVLLKPGPTSIAAPTLGPIIANDPLPIGSAINATVQFTDADAGDTHTATWTWDDGGPTPATSLIEPNGTTPGSASGSHVYTVAGVYNISVTVTDSGGKSSTVGGQVVVYDPNGGFVAGGGWITSPPGAYKADPTMSGRANFGFTSKYLKGATTPSGQTEFQFQSANLNFHSDSYDWLVVGGARAQYKGSGTINGSGSYKFMLTAVDGDLIGKGTPDRFRIRIWHHDDAANADVVDYDNQIDSETAGSNLEGTAIGGGSISIKTK